MSEPTVSNEPYPFTIWVKISSENREQGAWFFDEATARKHARPWEFVIPVEIDLRKESNDVS